jgi:hypothetical protein
MPRRMTAPNSPAPDKPTASRPLSELTKRVLSGIVLMAVALVTTWTGGLILVVAFSVLSFFRL